MCGSIYVYMAYTCAVKAAFSKAEPARHAPAAAARCLAVPVRPAGCRRLDADSAARPRRSLHGPTAGVCVQLSPTAGAKYGGLALSMQDWSSLDAAKLIGRRTHDRGAGASRVWHICARAGDVPRVGRACSLRQHQSVLQMSKLLLPCHRFQWIWPNLLHLTLPGACRGCSQDCNNVVHHTTAEGGSWQTHFSTPHPAVLEGKFTKHGFTTRIRVVEIVIRIVSCAAGTRARCQVGGGPQDRF